MTGMTETGMTETGMTRRECYLEIDRRALGTSGQDVCWSGEHSLAPGLMAVMTKENGKNLSNTYGGNWAT